jgi:hypothetical protein
MREVNLIKFTKVLLLHKKSSFSSAIEITLIFYLTATEFSISTQKLAVRNFDECNIVAGMQ